MSAHPREPPTGARRGRLFRVTSVTSVVVVVCPPWVGRRRGGGGGRATHPETGWVATHPKTGWVATHPKTSGSRPSPDGWVATYPPLGGSRPTPVSGWVARPTRRPAGDPPRGDRQQQMEEHERGGPAGPWAAARASGLTYAVPPPPLRQYNLIICYGLYYK